MKLFLMLSLIVLGLGRLAFSAGTPEGQVMDVEGAWFSCEFAHSQIPPADGCKMLDDDGFMVAGGRIDHIKVTDSDQRGCRHQRFGQCFDRTQAKITVSRDPVGPIRATGDGFAITYWGCTQDYKMARRGDYFEVTPNGGHCLWTKDKRYFVSRYRGKLEIGG